MHYLLATAVQRAGRTMRKMPTGKWAVPTPSMPELTPMQRQLNVYRLSKISDNWRIKARAMELIGSQPSQQPKDVELAKDPAPAQKTGEWSSPLCRCCEDCGICCIVFWCSCAVVPQLYERVVGPPGACRKWFRRLGLLCLINFFVMNVRNVWMSVTFTSWKRGSWDTYSYVPDVTVGAVSALLAFTAMIIVVRLLRAVRSKIRHNENIPVARHTYGPWSCTFGPFFCRRCGCGPFNCRRCSCGPVNCGRCSCRQCSCGPYSCSRRSCGPFSCGPWGFGPFGPWSWSCGERADDCCAAFWCTQCVQCQILRHLGLTWGRICCADDEARKRRRYTLRSATGERPAVAGRSSLDPDLLSDDPSMDAQEHHMLTVQEAEEEDLEREDLDPLDEEADHSEAAESDRESSAAHGESSAIRTGRLGTKLAVAV